MTNPSELTAKLQPGLNSGRLLSTRRGTIGAAVLAGLAALGVLLLFMSNYRDSVQSETADIKVLVADGPIDKGTSGDVIAEAGLFRPETISEADARDGAITDPAELKGQVVTDQIYSGQQLTAADLAPGADPIAGKLTGTQRALAVPVDKARGNVDQIEPGTHVDVLASYGTQLGNGRANGVVEVLARDVLVMRVPEGSDTSATSTDDDLPVVLRLTDEQANRVAYGADNGDVWLAIRPPTLGKDSKAAGHPYNGAGAGLLQLLGG